MKTPLLYSMLSLAGFASGAVTVNYSNDNAPGFALKDQNGVALSPGLADKPLDGTIIELGYYSLATTSNPFAGEWVPMVAPFQGNYITIGDLDVNDVAGLFQNTSIIGGGESYVLPAAGVPLTIRFYDTKTAQNFKNLYNAVSSSEWTWPGLTPDAILDMDLTDAVLIWEGGESSAFRTTLSAVPEASASMISMAGGIVFLLRRRRLSNTLKHSVSIS